MGGESRTIRQFEKWKCGSMNKIVVLYRSKYGATKKYAKWLAEDLIEVKDAKIEKVATYDTVILGGGIYASGIAGLPFLKKHYETLKGKKLIVFAVGASPYDEAAMVRENWRTFPAIIAEVPGTRMRCLGWMVSSALS